MPDDLRKFLLRAEHLRDGILTPEDARAWRCEQLTKLEDLGIIESAGHAEEIIYDGCDRECAIPNTGFQKHQEDPSSLSCIHRCLNGCGRVILGPQDFEQWRINLLGLAKAVRGAIGASGEVVEDVPGRLVLVGTVSVAGQVGEVFLGYGLARPDASGVAASATRLAVSAHAVVLSIGAKPGSIWSLGKTPLTAVLAEHARITPDGLDLDLSTVFPASGLVEVKPSDWISVTEAAELLIKDLPWLDKKKARSRVSKAASADHFNTNGKTRAARRIDRTSFSVWRILQRDLDLAKDDSNL